MASYKTVKQLNTITGINDLDFLLLYHNGVEESQENPDITGKITLQDVKELILNDIDIPASSVELQNIRDGISGTSIEEGCLEDNADSHAGTTQNYACGKYSHAEGFGTKTGQFLNQQDKTINTSLGAYAHVEGYFSQAKANGSHAEGYNTIAGGGTKIIDGEEWPTGNSSHAEGYFSQAKGDFSHAEGRETIALEICSHAEGFSSQANGQASHAEGSNTIASGYISHAGGEGTIAQRLAQTVIGRYNSRDTQGLNQNSYGEYAFIIGNGDSENSRSNAFTVDWTGIVTANQLTANTVITAEVDASQLYSADGAQNLNNDQVPTVDQIQDALTLASFEDRGSSDLTQTPIKIDITNIFYHQNTNFNEQLTIILSEVDTTNNKVVILDTVKIPFVYLTSWLNNSNMNLNQINGYAADKDIEYCFKIETVNNVIYLYFEILSIPTNKQIHAQIYYKTNDFYLPIFNSGGGME